MLHATPDEWSFEDWTLIETVFRDARHEKCPYYKCDTTDALLEDSAWYWDLDDRELQGILA